MTNPTPPRSPRINDMLLFGDHDRPAYVSCPVPLAGEHDRDSGQPVDTIGEALEVGRRHLERFHPAPPAPPQPGDEMRALLVAGARYTGWLGPRGAVHLLTFTDLPAWRGFPALVDIERDADDRVRGERYDIALVRGWRSLANDTRAAQVSGSGRQMLNLAVSMASGAPVDLRQTLAGLGHAHARRVLEAVAIAAGADEFYTLAPTPKLAELESFHAQVQGGNR